MKKPTRKHLPCRECGTSHNNTLSSTICDSCGKKLHTENLKQAELRQAELKQAELEDEVDLGERITELERLVEKYKCHIVELHDELSGYEELCDIIIAQDDLDVDSEAFGRLGLKILGKAQDKLGLVDRVRMRELNK